MFKAVFLTYVSGLGVYGMSLPEVAYVICRTGASSYQSLLLLALCFRVCYLLAVSASCNKIQINLPFLERTHT